MKKKYLKPETECAVVNMEWAMCQQPATTGKNDENITDPEHLVPWSSPKRRVF